MIKFPFDAVAFDLDDTLLKDDLSISDDTVLLLRSLAATGVKIIPASGRTRLSMKPFLDRLACSDLYICCNGAEIWESSSNRLLRAEILSAELGKEIAAFGNRHHCYMQTYEGAYFFYNEKTIWAEKYASASVLKGMYVGNLESYICKPLNKILMMADESKIASMLTEARAQFSGRVSVTCSKPWFLEFNPIGASKGRALAFAAEYFRLSISRFIAFGDGLNDLSMLQAAGRGVMMANGRADLFSLADDVCCSNQEDGVAKYLAGIWEATS